MSGAALRLSPEPVTAPPARISPTLLERIEVPVELSTWRVDADQASLVDYAHPPGSEPIRTLRLASQSVRYVYVPGTFDPAGFNRVRVEMRTTFDVRVGVFMRRDGEQVVAARPTLVPRSDVLRSEEFELPGNRLQSEPFDELVVALQGGRGMAQLASLELEHRPDHSVLPSAGGPFELVDVGGEARRGVGLSTTRSLECEVTVPELGVLSVSFAVPEALRLPDAAPELHITVVAEDGAEQVHRFPVAYDEDHGARWQTARVPLATLARQRVILRFSLVAAEHEEHEQWCALGEPALFSAHAEPATVLLVTSDTHRADHLGAAGRGVEVRTPTLDDLAARGVLFEDCFSSTNTTNPSHVAIMTGVHPRDTRVLDNSTPVDDAAQTLAECFRDAGFATFAALSSAHLGDHGSGLGQGFDRMSVPRARDWNADDAIADALRWLPDAEGRSLFLWVHLFDAHTPYGPPSEYTELYYRDVSAAFDPEAPPLDFGGRAGKPTFLNGVTDLEYPLALYKGEVSYLDACLGELFADERLGGGVIAVTADHGESLGAHDIYFGHTGLYPDSIHVPLILAWPEGPAGVRIERPVDQLDLASTLLALADLDSAQLPGRGLLDAIEGEDTGIEPRFSLSANAYSAAVTDEGWHLILHLISQPGGEVRTIRTERHAVELYDLNVDPGCATNLVEVELDRARTLRTTLIDWLEASSPEPWKGDAVTDATFLENLHDLGYTDAGSVVVRDELFDAECACEWCERFR